MNLLVPPFVVPLQTCVVLLLAMTLLGTPVLAAQDGLLTRPAAVPYLNVPPSPPVPSGNFTITPAYPNLFFQSAIAVRPVPRSRRMWVLEREGRIWSFDQDSPTAKTLVLDLNDDDVIPNEVDNPATSDVDESMAGHVTNGVHWWCQGWDDCGLMGLAFHPDFGVADTNNGNRGYFYISYQAKSTIPDVGLSGNDYRPNSATGAQNTRNRVARFQILDGQASAVLTSEQILIDQPDDHLWHNGGDMFFGGDGFLYCVNGDSGNSYDPAKNSQRITKGMFSGVIRIDVDWTANSTRSHAPPPRQTGQPALLSGYGIPNDNPFVGIPGVLEEFYAIGLRSPHRMTYDAVTGLVLIGDIGQGQREEVTQVTRGSNHQWSYMEGFANKRVDGNIREERIPQPYLTSAAVTAANSSVALTYTTDAADPGLFPGMLNAGDRVRFGQVVAQILSLSAYPYTSATFNDPLGQDIPAGTPMIRTTGLRVTRSIIADPFAIPTDSTPDNNNVPSGLGTTTLPVSGIGTVTVGMSVSFGVTGAYGSYQVIAASDNGTNTTSITVRPRVPVDLPNNTWVDRLTVIGNEQPPIADFLHGGTGYAFNAVIGGYIYRGPGHPDLNGSYIFADNPRGTFYAMTGIGTMSPTITQIFSIAGYSAGAVGGYHGISGFGLDHEDELLICRMQTNTSATNTSSGQIFKIIRTGGTVVGTPIPTDLAQTGAFVTDGIGNLVLPLRPAPGLIPYGVNSPLWSDNALKSRWISLPTGEQAVFDSTDAFSFPAGTVFVKHFELADYAFPNHRRMLETRLLIRSPGTGVYGVTYKWNAAGTQATLLNDGLNQSYTITDADNSTHQQTWTYPSRDDCLTCHNAGAGHVLGVTSRQLNGNFTYPAAGDQSIYQYNGTNDNQLSTWSHIGMFNGAPLDGDIPSLPRMVHVSDTSATLATRVRSWLDANCSHCHRPGGVHAEFDARFKTPLESQGLIDGPVNNNLGIPFARVLAPGGVTRSIMHLRDNSLASGTKMPPLAKNMIDTAAINAMTAWIMSMNVPLMIEITSPTLNGIVALPGPITIRASTGYSENVNYVEFFVNGVSPGDIAKDYMEPYTFEWTPSGAGAFNLTAVVHDGTTTATSSVVTVQATQIPTVVLTAPANNATDAAPGWFTLTATATASLPGDSISMVEFLRDDVVVANDMNAPFTTVLSNLAAGTYTFTARATNNVGGTGISAPVQVTVTGFSGLTAEYWTNMNLSGAPALTRTESGVNYDWGNGSPAAAIPNNGFSTRWSGTVTAPVTGTYSFYTTTDDGVRLWVNNQLIFTHWVDQGPTLWTGTIALTAGNPVTIRMEYFENGGGASARLEWSATGVPRAVIPLGALAPSVAPTVALTAPTTDNAFAPATITLNATAADSDGVIAAVEFLQGGTVIATDTAAPYTFNVPSLPPGTYVFAARATDSQGQITTSSSATVTVVKGPATITLAGLTPTYDSNPKSVTPTTNPPGLTVTFTYNGSAIAPTNAGTYAVIATINDVNYTGTVSDTLIIAKATAPVVLTPADLSQVYTTTPRVVRATTTPAGMNVDLTYNGSATPPTAAGTYPLSAVLNNANYQGTTTGTLTITKATAPVVLTPADLSQVYTTTPRVVRATTTPAGMNVDLIYNGSATPPTAAGTYPLSAVLNNANYQGTTTGTLTITKANAPIAVTQLVQTIDGQPKPVTVTTVPAGLMVDVTYDGSATAPSAEATYTVTANVNDANYSGMANAILVLTSQPVISVDPAAIAEGNAGTSTATLTATLSTTSTAIITVDWAASAGTATAATDFTVASGTLTFAPGVTSQPIAISVLGDTAFESNETVIVTLSNPSQVVIGTTTAVLTITNDDANTAPVISEGATVAATGDEDNTPTAFALTLHANDVDAGQTLTWSIITAPSHGTLAPLGSGTTQPISYAPTANFNGNDSFTVRVSDGFAGTANCVVTVAIVPRNDAPVLVTAPVVTLAAVSSATTGTWSDAIDVTPGTITTAVQWQRADDASGTNVADLPGEISSSYTLTNTDVGKFLRVRVTASDNGEGLPSTTSTIAYSAYVLLTSEPVVSIAPVSVAEGNAGTSTATLTAALSIASTSAITVDWAASAGTASAGTDFTVASGTLTFAPGVTSQPITISVLGDTAFESNETVVVTLSNPSQVVIGTTTAILTITNDDTNTAPVISEGAAVAATGDEDNTPTAFALTLHASDVDAGQTLTWSIITAPSHGTLAPLGSGSAQLISYAPTANFNGSDSFTVRVSDDFAGTADCVVTVTIAPRNDAPVLVTAPVVTLAAVCTATTGTWSDAADVTPGTITTAVQWQRADDASGTNVADLPGEITTSHTVTSADAGKFLRVRVTASDNGEGLPSTASTSADAAYVAVPAPSGTGSSSGGSPSGGGCGLGSGITGLLALVFLMLRRQRLH